MAASKSYFARSSARFLPTDPSFINESMMFELDESEVFHSTAVAAVAAAAQSPDVRKTSSRISRKPSSVARVGSVGHAGGPASLPVNVPDWSKILKGEYRENRREDDSDGDEEAEEGMGSRIPPHEFVAARTRTASASVHEGIGRTLKGRDLSRVRNAIWQKTGFED